MMKTDHTVFLLMSEYLLSKLRDWEDKLAETIKVFP
jgi:hypothetical protein